VTVLRKAILLNPANPGPYNTLAQVLRQKGDIEGSKAAFAEGAKAKAKIDARSVEMLRGKK